MTVQLQEAIDLAESLSMTEKLELLKTLSLIIQEAHALENQSHSNGDDADFRFSPESFRRSWEQAVTGQTLPLSALWDENGVE